MVARKRPAKTVIRPKPKPSRSLAGLIRTMWATVLPGVSAMLILTIDNLFNLGVPVWLCIPIGGVLYGVKKYYFPDTIL